MRMCRQKTNKSAPLAFAVLQPGARLHYAVPAILDRAGLLARFYTDFCADAPTLRLIKRIWSTHLQPAPVQRMLARTLPASLSHSKVRQTRRLRMRVLLQYLLGSRSRAPSISQSIMQTARSDGFGNANAIYTVIINEDLEFCEEAKKHGYRIVHEVMMNPDAGLLMAEESHLHARTYHVKTDLAQIEAGRSRDSRKYQISDLILVPSDYVYRSVVAMGADPRKVEIVPYGVDRNWLGTTPQPVRGRVLFVGNVSLLKGSHYLAQAARILADRKVACEVRVVGPMHKSQRRDPFFQGPHYVGQVPRSSIQSEFLAADIFVLPTLSDGFALAHLEALACGLPVITTPNCGSVVRDGIEGIIVPIRDATAIANAIEHLITDRKIREEMSSYARERARDYTWERYGDRLIHALSKLESNSAENCR